MTLRQIYYSLSPRLRLWARRLFYFPSDLLDSLGGKRGRLVPPKGLIFTGSGDFEKQGRQFLKHFIEYGGLRPHHRVLDIGSGIGRMAIPLTEYLNKKGSYEGFDIVPEGVAWCRKNISSRFPNFHFTLVNLSNDLYRRGEMDASDFRFPYPNESFDFVFLTSVFTHMLPDEVAHYIGEIHRVLKSGGRCFATFFILNEGSEKGMNEASGNFRFHYEKGHYSLMDKKVKSANVAYEETWLFRVLAETGFEILEKLDGYWPGKEKSECLDFQDIVVFKKNDFLIN